jgi:hypothetical protein
VNAVPEPVPAEENEEAAIYFEGTVLYLSKYKFSFSSSSSLLQLFMSFVLHADPFPFIPTLAHFIHSF